MQMVMAVLAPFSRTSIRCCFVHALLGLSEAIGSDDHVGIVLVMAVRSSYRIMLP